MSWFSKLTGRGAGQPPAVPPAQGDVRHPMPLGLRVGGRVALDLTLYRVAPGAMTAELPEGHQGVACYGHIDLGDGYAMHRFYLEDDAYLQVMTCGGLVESIKGFVFHHTVNPPTKHHFQQFVTADPHLGAQEIDYAGRRWQRVTSPEGGAQIPPMAFDEVLYRGEPPRRDDDLTHYAMVYGRHVPELDREEFLLVTGEDSGPDDFCVTYAVGIDLTEADLDIT